ncbi:MAG: Fimbrial protein pilin [Candidatus Curtissbacteria bacterium GW2011_GWA1_40_47]|uniref:Fimbrial protein pilin n=1 Tax=Candidatus Nomurabacteria bacterium GW2011_GWC2_42_20 TaxID=1618756 RepID=A0A0G1BQ08_9BACT|nr:MAG: Fimbrial protein pilin [Candidatus Curtissbacteria bacterium GW2011_GWA1_40_47]KKS27075.1 MAG: Fimbrial protein pilin [Parcubacteria group bacterium GW2011_GWC1_42_11]KKS48316.1 MAG: Fimbrial protein pilin [Candidatus Nomurabacteria bacterium GW2011_GWC2_42_20]KKS58382.1 MAG: Fimbrial protein pilin [Candidatus Nomurabacteria bacterium GW2011_GWA2_42_41]
MKSKDLILMSFLKKNSGGFTLIELLVVIAIIGILASVVLASLNTARTKGADAAIKSNLVNIRAQAELVYDTGSTYVGVCTDTKIASALATATSTGGNGGECSEASDTWTAWAGLKGTLTDAWCVDNAGASKQVTKPVGAITVCP